MPCHMNNYKSTHKQRVSIQLLPEKGLTMVLMVTKLLHRSIHSFTTTAALCFGFDLFSVLSLSLSFGPLFYFQLKAAQKDLELPPDALLAAAAPANGFGLEAL